MAKAYAYQCGFKDARIIAVGCHNPDTWDFNGGYEIDELEFQNKIVNLISQNNIKRNLSLLGGEPLCEENIEFALRLLAKVKSVYPNIITYVWTGNTFEKLKKQYGSGIFNAIDVLIDGPFIQEQRDLTLKLCGSRNQRILRKGIDF